MVLTRNELREQFRRLEIQLREMASSGAPEEDLWLTIELLTHVPASAVSDSDRQWWWQQLYDTLERHGLSELSTLAGDVG